MDTLNKLIVAFVALIVGISLIGTISISANSIASAPYVINETQSLTGALRVNGVGTGIVNTTYPFQVTHSPTGWQLQDCPLTGISIVNATNTALTKDTHYTFYPANGTWYLKGVTVNTTHFNANNNSYVSYTYCGDDYLSQSWGRGVMGITTGMFALGLLGVSIGLFYSIGKDFGLV